MYLYPSYVVVGYENTNERDESNYGRVNGRSERDNNE
jgi:hypothetical protein